MNPIRDRFLATLTSRIEDAGYPTHTLLDSASEIVVFGSCAAGVDSAASDLDVMCFGEGPRIKTPALDLLWVPERLTTATDWLGSELATHVSKYGVPLRGRALWRSSAWFSPEATTRKRRRIARLIEAASLGWENLHPVFHKRYQKTIRREFQRYGCLLTQAAVPPTPVLDREWLGLGASILNLVACAELGEQTPFAMHLLSAGEDQLRDRPLVAGPPLRFL
ncbi:MAG TPA: hypothetical protein VK788_24770 [Terriglobales bacterium]|jgi:hypothetical protein|nr:hypothetical protein [Terriglobales bacterium]